MKQTNKIKFKTLLLSILTLLIACVYVFSACGSNSSTDDDDEETTKTDTQTFANADFEYFDDNSKSYLIYTPNNWSKSSGSNALGDSASSSLAKSGIVDTAKDWGTVFTNAKSNYDTYKDTSSDDIPDDVDYYTDIDNDYDIPGWDIANDAKTSDTLETETIKDAADLANPGTRWGTNKEEVDKNGSHVLMLHNYRSDRDARGTAAKYTSSSITVTMNTAVKVSVWVKTYGMTDYKGNEVSTTSPRGAYVAINNTVGGSSQDALYVNNINTANVSEENNGWVQYSFYIKASTYASTSFSLVLGLGQGGGNNKLEYVDGYAFFDDVEYEVMTADEYDTATQDIGSDYTYALNLGLENNENKKDSRNDTRPEKVYALNLSKSFTALTPTVSSKGLTVDSYGQTVISATGKDLIDAKDKSGDITTASAIKSDSGMSATVKNAFENYPFGNSSVLLIASYKGANYTAKLNKTWTVGSEKYVAVSFWVKTSELQGGTGATVTLYDASNATTIGAVDTTTLTQVDIKDDNGTQEDIFDGWQQCFLFVENQTKSDLTFTLEFSYGVMTNAGTALSSYTEGFAAFTGFAETEMTEQEFALKSTGTYAVSTSLVGNYKSATYGGGFDDVAYAPTDKIESGFADTRAYDGVYGGSTYVGGTNVVSSAKNDYANAGLLNKAYASTYYDNNAAIKSFVNSYTAATVNAENWWNTILGTSANQPLFITNATNSKVTSYGYVAKNASTLSASSYTTISYRVMVSEGAVANLYLIDTTAPDSINDVRYANSLDFKSGVSYRYDSNGNLVAKDPESNDYSPKADTLLYIQENGLWAKTKNYSGSELYANLANYGVDDNGNLIDTNDNIVYYAYEGKFYRYFDEDTKKYSVEVQDFTNALPQAQLDAALIQNKTNAVLSQTIVGTSTNAYKWIYVNFYIANGDTSKNYRLEVWNGSRDGSVQMAENSTVIFDKISGNSLTSDTYASHLKENMLNAYPSYANQTQIKKAYENGSLTTSSNANIVYYHYSLYDDSDYAPYDADYDTENSGNPYEEYDGTAYENTVAYFAYNDGVTYNTFVDYTTVDKTISSSSSDSDTDDTTTTNDSEQNIWLLVSSIILAVALVITLISMLVRKLVANIKKGKLAKKTNNAYSNKRTRYMRKLKLAESTDYENEADDVLPEDEEISEEEIYQVEESGEEIKEESDENNDNE